MTNCIKCPEIFIHLSIHSFVHSFIHSFVHSFIHSLDGWFISSSYIPLQWNIYRQQLWRWFILNLSTCHQLFFINKHSVILYEWRYLLSTELYSFIFKLSNIIASSNSIFNAIFITIFCNYGTIIFKSFSTLILIVFCGMFLTV